MAALLCAAALVRWEIWSYGSDLGTFAQIVQNAFHGFTDGPEAGTHFRFHFSPILVLLWPLVALTHSPLVLQFVQAFLIVGTVFPLASIVRSYAGATWGWRVGALALLYPPLISAAFLEFHELAFFPILALALIAAADRARWGWFALFALASVCIREDTTLDLAIVGLALGVIGCMRASSRQRGLLAGEPIEPRRLAIAGFALAALCVGLLVFYFALTARLGRWAPSHFYVYSFARGPLQVALAPFTHPIAFAHAICTPGRLTYLLEAFAPLAFLPLRTRWTWLAVPGLLGVLLSSIVMTWRMGYHYELLWAPWLLLGAAWALVRIREMRGEELARRWWIAALAVCFIVLLAFDPMHPLHYLTPAPYQDSADVRRAFACVPHDAAVATHDQWFAELALAYPHVTEIAPGISGFNGYVVYTPDWQNAAFQASVLPEIADARARGIFTVVCRIGDVIVLRR